MAPEFQLVSYMSYAPLYTPFPGRQAPPLSLVPDCSSTDVRWELYVPSAKCSQGAPALCHVCVFSGPHDAKHTVMLQALMVYWSA